MPLTDGVMFAEYTTFRSPKGSAVPPAKRMFGTGLPWSSAVVWQSPQTPSTSTSYSPRFSGVDRSAVTGRSTGSGKPLIRYFTGNGTFDFGRGFLRGVSERKYTMIDARSSSD